MRPGGKTVNPRGKRGGDPGAGRFGVAVKSQQAKKTCDPSSISSRSKKGIEKKEVAKGLPGPSACGGPSTMNSEKILTID